MNTVSKIIEHEKQHTDPLLKIHDPNLISVNIEDGWVELEKLNEIEEIQQANEAEKEIIMTMVEKGLIKQMHDYTSHCHYSVSMQ
ncbi:MAG: hypothetical protein KAI22_12040 [Gammaproteobacteria bacterium]|nr:hypothetical protein [Gammaproteobacteria bacterium]